MKKGIGKVLVFVINILLMVIGVLAIKEHDQKRLTQEATDSTTEQSAADSNLMNAQSAISTDRENKLRNLNNTPSQLSQQDTTTKTTTTKTTTPASSGSSPKSSTKTKTS